MYIFPLWIKFNNIVPMVFDDSLSYVEFLARVSGKLNEVIKTVNDMNIAFTEYEKMIKELFDSFTEEVDKKIETAKEEIHEEWEQLKEEIQTELDNLTEEVRANYTELDGKITNLNELLNTNIQDIREALGEMEQSVLQISLRDKNIGVFHGEIDENGNTQLLAFGNTDFNKPIFPKMSVNIIACTAEEYAEMPTHDANTLYIIRGETE